MHQDLGRLDEDLPLAEEAYRLADSNGYTALAQQIKQILDKIRTAK